ncbi:hypothetical protein LGN17_22385 [Burkholderia sp. AU30280]|uniref:hypothetical protein n=1 Tax=Burkholderia sp. AU30280 TaxID=2879628 RepID=UPI001CF2DB88|nr:hypothetical protein [Burkholderia sp. AU30280]MCA8275238.1 hypothetical protein [Burkholderia sp. AU30280]
MAEFAHPERPISEQDVLDLFICNLPIGPDVVASLFREKWDDRAVWICMIEPATGVPVHTTVPLSELDQFLLTLIGRYSPETTLM